MSACNEATVDPIIIEDNTAKNKSIELILRTQWELNVNDNSNLSWIMFYKDLKVFIKKDDKYYGGTWKMNSNGNQITINTRENGNIISNTFNLKYIDTIGSEKLMLNNSIVNPSEYHTYLPVRGYTRVGNIVSKTINYKTKITIPPTARVYVIWDVHSGSNSSYSYIWGKSGAIDTIGSFPFEIMFSSDEPPVETMNSFSDGNDFIAVGRVVLTTDVLKEGKTTREFIPNNFIGGFEKQLIVYRKGVFESGYTKWANKFPFDFQVAGYNYDMNQLTDTLYQDYNPVLVIDTNAKTNFKNPLWYF